MSTPAATARVGAMAAQPDTGHPAFSDTDAPRCAVCLDDEITDRAVLDGCFHPFCFECISVWARQALVCPLCKSSFRAAIHNIVSNTDYTVHVFPAVKSSGGGGGGGGGPAAAAAARPRPPWGQPVYTESRTSSRAALTLELRRAVYADSLTHRPVPLGKYTPRDLSPSAFDPVHGGLRRVLPWLKRELFVLCGANQEHLDFLLQLVCALLCRAGLENRAPLQAELEPFFMRNTERFLSELTSFAMSPFDMVCYDQLVTYSRGPRRQRADHGAASVVAGKRAAPTSHERDSRRTKRRFDRNDESRRRTTRLCAAAAVGSSGLRAAMLAVDPLVQPSSLDITRPSAVGDGPDRRSPTGTIRSKDEGQPGRAAHTARTAPPSTHCRNDQSTQRAEQQVGRGQSVQRTEEELQCRLKVVNHRLALARKRLETLRADKKRAS